ncbi:MAG: polysaccharide biosynthesis tyrosine autokinase [Polyangiaceae bacterium]|nr:polysaccharide biosynthesis tyrosine autokinase [Polyangiaceae bacterium]
MQSQLQSHAPPGDSDGLTLLQIWKAARKRWPLVAFLAVACAVAAIFYGLGQTVHYRSSATVLIDPNSTKPLGKDVDRVVDFDAYWTHKEYFETQLEVIKSRLIAAEAVRRLALNRDPGFISGTSKPKSKAGTRPHQIGETTAANMLRGRLKVEQQEKTRIVEVSYEDADPLRAQRILQTVLDAYVQHNLDEIAASSQSAGQWLRDRLVKLKEDLEQSELDLHRYKKNKSILSVSYDDQSNILREQIAQLNQRITAARAQREKVAARYQALTSIDTEDPSELPASELLVSPLLDKLRTDYITAQRERERLLAGGKGQNHPEVQAAESAVQNVKTTLLTELHNIQNGVKKDLDALTAETNGLSKLYGAAKQQALELNMLEIEYNRLERLKDNNEKLYSLVLERSKESDLTSLMQVNNIRVLDAPLRGASLGPSVPLFAAVGLLAGLVLGLGAAVGRELLDLSVKSPDDLEQQLGVPFLGLLPKADAANSSPYYGYGRRRRARAERTAEPGSVELMVHQHPKSGVAEAARTIRTNLFFMAPDNPYKTLLVTSPGPGEGKTTIACVIAIAMAQAGHRVLLVDCDLRRPRLHRIFRRDGEGQREGVSVAQAIVERALPSQEGLKTTVPNLDVLPAGPHVPNPAELLGSESFQSLLSDLSRRYDRVVIDSPPVAAVTDATVLSTRVDGTVLVVRALSTSRDMARRSARSISDVGGRVVGTVLNAAESRRGRGGYYYYYYRGSYEASREDAA